MDVLSEVIASMRTGLPAATRTDARAPWAMRLRPVAGPGFHVILEGACWLVPPSGPSGPSELGGVGEAGEPVELAAGDVVFLRSGREHVLADDPATTPTRLHTGPDGGGGFGELTIEGPGARTVMLCGAYDLDQARPHPLLRGLPPVIHVRARHGRHPELRSAVALLCAELSGGRPGADGIVPPMIDVLLFYVLRAWLDEADAPDGWAAALTDPGISRALKAIHEEPGRPWTVEALGRCAGLSRAAFARRFAALVGEPPLAYLTRWRMTTAGRLLRETRDPLSAVAERTGYTSEFAFAKAFKREFGVAPGGYRKSAARPRSA
ncbi:IS5 family transposase IS4811 [Actinomadura sp. RB99]|uniref:AraC family transcriptional regulator n=1 Tax=Actinomadura sp. RB99 TaxID=2691577 RepID=UPI001688AADE|nr:AraC family transcriptional regulator [Actinomadura sp. RB99]MBD2893572.1 IS5 family transposase IS4811 [Actinomadura sp. RB99]